MDWLYVLAQPFVWHPGRALLVAGGLLLIALLFRSGRRPLLLATAAWILFAGQEFAAWRERSDIRVDLLITWPILCFLTAACLGVALKRMLARAVQ
jgi:hypothetical protein